MIQTVPLPAALQNRVLYTTQKLANSIRTGQIDINKIDENTKDIIVATRGSPGGSIFMKKDFFENVGGLDYYYFWICISTTLGYIMCKFSNHFI